MLANLFMHYAFDTWMAREFPAVPFERYADDAVVHCVSERQAGLLARAIGDRMAQVGLRLHPAKTKVVYCKDSNRRLGQSNRSSPSWGTRSGTRGARQGREVFTSFLPAISKDALNKISAEVRSWRLHRRTGHTFADLAREINPVVRGWMQYYGAFYRSRCIPSCRASIPTWCAGSARSTNGCGEPGKPASAWQGITTRYPRLYAHWKWVLSRRLLIKMTRAV